MYCTNCGGKMSAEDRFCAGCGKPVSVQPAPGPAPSGQPRRLARLMSEKKIAGVCAGVARYFGFDVTVVRVIWLVLAICTVVPGFLAYLIAWIAMPKEYGLRQSSGEMAVSPG